MLDSKEVKAVKEEYDRIYGGTAMEAALSNNWVGHVYKMHQWGAGTLNNASLMIPHSIWQELGFMFSSTARNESTACYSEHSRR